MIYMLLFLRVYEITETNQ